MTATATAEFLSPITKATGALFNVPRAEQKENGPIMTGSIEVDSHRILLSGFLKTSNTNGTRYMSLSLAAPLQEGHTEEDRENQLRYYGKLFSQSEKRSENSPDYTGFISVLPCTSREQYSNEEWDAAPVLQVWGRRRRSSDGSSRIAITIAPREVASEEVNF